MKKLFILVGCISQILLSCHKNHDPILLSQKMPGLKSPGIKKLSFKVTDIYSRLYAIKRRIEIINQRTNVVLGKMFITISCDDPKDNLYRKLNFEPEKFSGQITLESHQLIEFTKRISNGKLVKVKNNNSHDIQVNANCGFELKPDPDSVSKLNPDSDNTLDRNCTFFSILECIQTAFLNMDLQGFTRVALSASIWFNETFGNCLGKLCE